MVASDANNNPARPCKSFLAQVIVINHPNEIRAGYTPVFLCHSAKFAAKFTEIRSRVDKKNPSQLLEENPESIKNNDNAMVLVTPIKEVYVETYKDFPALGRFAVRDMNTTVAIGIIKEVFYE